MSSRLMRNSGFTVNKILASSQRDLADIIVGISYGDATDSDDLKKRMGSDALPGGSKSSIRRYENPADIAAVIYRYGSFIKRYGIDTGNTDTTAVVDSIRKKYKRKDSWIRLDVFPGDRK